jgi:hypothetical protein
MRDEQKPTYTILNQFTAIILRGNNYMMLHDMYFRTQVKASIFHSFLHPICEIYSMHIHAL